MRRLFFYLMVSAALAAACPLQAQDDRGKDFSSSVPGERYLHTIGIGIRGGLVSSAPRGAFPSLLVGDAATPTGEIPDSLAQSAYGNRYEAYLNVLFSSRFAMTFMVGTITSNILYESASPSARMEFAVQNLQLAVTAEGSIYADYARPAGLRRFYLGGGLDIGLVEMADRIETTFPLSSPEAPRRIGSFPNNSPFRNVVRLRALAGVSFAVNTSLELHAETSYDYAVNPVFSGNSVPDTDFSIDNTAFIVGIGYRY